MNAGTWIQGPSALWTLGAQATELLFDAGQRHALADQAAHLRSPAAGTGALFSWPSNDVKTALRPENLEQESGVEQKAVESAQHLLRYLQPALQGARHQLLEVAYVRGTLLQNQRTAIDIETRQFVASVGLVRALGGGWDASQLPK